MDLYIWNSQAAAAFYESLHLLEVALRNTLNNALTAHWSPTWYRDRSVPLSPGSRTEVAKAIQRATQGGITESPGRVVAELTFGFWWSLLGDNYDQRLWKPCLKQAFPASVRRRRLHATLDDLRRLRNRCAHHEPIFIRSSPVAWCISGDPLVLLFRR